MILHRAVLLRFVTSVNEMPSLFNENFSHTKPRIFFLLFQHRDGHRAKTRHWTGVLDSLGSCNHGDLMNEKIINNYKLSIILSKYHDFLSMLYNVHPQIKD